MLKIKTFIDEDFTNFKEPSMFIATSTCDFKCERECGVACCHNSDLVNSPTIEIDDEKIIERYLDNPITSAICFGGLEPLDQEDEVKSFILKLRNKYHCSDTVVIYTGYERREAMDFIEWVYYNVHNIIIKFGRFVPGDEKHFDNTLGVFLASENQSAVLFP